MLGPSKELGKVEITELEILNHAAPQGIINLAKLSKVSISSIVAKNVENRDGIIFIQEAVGSNTNPDDFSLNYLDFSFVKSFRCGCLCLLKSKYVKTESLKCFNVTVTFVLDQNAATNTTLGGGIADDGGEFNIYTSINLLNISASIPENTKEPLAMMGLNKATCIFSSSKFIQLFNFQCGGSSQSSLMNGNSSIFALYHEDSTISIRDCLFSNNKLFGILNFKTVNEAYIVNTVFSYNTGLNDSSSVTVRVQSSFLIESTSFISNLFWSI